MQINLESAEKHAVQAYSHHEIKVNGIIYQQNLIINAKQIISNWNIKEINALNEALLAPLLENHPKIILIGHASSQFPSGLIFQTLLNRQISLECMSIGAACRTYNILLNEKRDVVLGIIFDDRENITKDPTLRDLL